MYSHRRGQLQGCTVKARTVLATVLGALMMCGGMAMTSAADETGTPAAADLNAGDRKFVQMTADMGAREIQFSERAKTKAQSEEVQAFAQAMIEHHGRTNRELEQLVTRFHESGGPPYKRQDRSVKKAVAELAALEGAQFDRRYMEAMVKDHRQSVKLFERQANNGKDPELKAYAARMLPTLKEHLARAEKISASLK